MPEAGDVPGKRETCPPVRAYFPRLRGNEGDRGLYVGEAANRVTSPTFSTPPVYQVTARSQLVGIWY